MASGTVVVDRDNRVVVALCQCADYVCHALLHFGVGALHGIQLNSVGILAGLYRAYRSATHSDAVVVSAHHHDFLSGNGSAFDGVFFGGETYATGEHDNLVVGIHAPVFVMLECQERAADEGLPEFVAEVGSAV